MSKARRRIPTYVVLPARTLLLDVAGPLEALRYANLAQSDIVFDVRYVGPLPAVTTSIGLRISDIAALPETIEDGAMILVSGHADVPMEAGHRHEPAGAGSEEIVEWLRAVVRPGVMLVSICSGALLAARAGLLDGVRCTTHFSDCAALAEIAPTATVLENRLYVEDGDRYSSAGITAGIDLMLHIIGRLAGPAISASVARSLVVYLRRAGTDPQLSPWFEGRNHIHRAIHRVQDAVTADPARTWSLDELARVAGTSPRHLSRLFNEETGMSIPDYCNRLRVALAQQMLSETRLDIESVAERAGFGSSRQLRRVWGRFNAAPPSTLRRLGASG